MFVCMRFFDRKISHSLDVGFGFDLKASEGHNMDYVNALDR
jgi:hypothetical protein